MKISLLWSQCPFLAAPQTRAAPRPISLLKRQVWSAKLPAGTRLEVRSGVVWLTQSGDASDYLLRAGEDFTLRSNGKIVIQALETACLGLVKASADHPSRNQRCGGSDANS